MVPSARHLRGLVVLLVTSLALPVPALAETTPAPVSPQGAAGVEATPFRLLMVEQRGCHYCERWTAEVGEGYAASAEGALAPLTRVDLRGDWPEGLVIGRRPALTPTFILLKDNAEVARLEGYPGEDFFWGLLDRMLIEAGAPLAADGKTVGSAAPKG